ncbi:MAG: efflux RND transporter permease subunit, partial [Betaproteobacteria bacterium]|nr:efflux RND transporter permease subunit [Betaproteobacteria bacterium]
RMQATYLRLLTPLLHRRAARWTLLGAVSLGLLGAMMMPAWQFLRPAGMNGPLSALGVELRMLPFDNTSTFLVEVDTPAGSPLELTDEVARACGEVLARVPEVVDWQTFVGQPAPLDFAALVRGDNLARGDELAQIRVNLLPKAQRSRSSHEIVQALWSELAPVRARFPGTRIKLFETPPGPPVRSQIQAELFGPDYAGLRRLAPAVLKDFDTTYGMINQDDSVSAPSTEYRLHVDVRKAALAGITPAEVAQLLHPLVAGAKVGALHVTGALEPVDIVLRMDRAGRQRMQQLLDLPLRSADGTLVPLGSFASVESVQRSRPIYTRDQHPVVYVTGEMLGASPVYATLSLNGRLDERQPIPGTTVRTANLGFTPTPPSGLRGVQLLWGGEMRLTLDVFRDLGSAFIVALLFIYLLLVAYYRSFALPLIVMGAIPLTLLGVFPGHWLTHQAFTATSMIGVIALAGIVVRNSLLLIDFILDYRARGFSLEQAVAEAGAVRLRPIVLTALAIMFGSAIMITDPVFGGLAVSLVFGTLVSTLLTLVVIPLLYYMWSRRAQPPAAT